MPVGRTGGVTITTYIDYYEIFTFNIRHTILIDGHLLPRLRKLQ